MYFSILSENEIKQAVYKEETGENLLHLINRNVHTNEMFEEIWILHRALFDDAKLKEILIKKPIFESFRSIFGNNRFGYTIRKCFESYAAVHLENIIFS